MMKKAVNKFSLTIFKKIVMSITGLMMVLFLILHLAGNILMFFGKDLYNQYSAVLLAIPIITPGLELGLVVILLIHVWEAIQIKIINKQARPSRYEGGKVWATEKSDRSRKNISSVLMMWSGVIIFIFIVAHVWMFKYGTHYTYTPGGGSAFVQLPSANESGLQNAAVPLQVVERGQIRDLYRLVVENFKNPLIAVLYMLAMVVLGSHLYHAVWSTSQSLGSTNPHWRRIMLWGGTALALAIAAGFFIFPLWIYFFVSIK